MDAHVELPLERRRVDVEWRAFAAGAKPAIRLAVSPEEADVVVDRYQGLGAATTRNDVGQFHGSPTTFVYVAHTTAEAEALRDIEVRILARRSDRHALIRELGERLGFPSCCARAFSLRMRRLHVWWRSPWPRRVDTWHEAREAWIPNPHPRLNHHLQRERRSLVSFEPCRYDCPRALTVADRIAAAVREDEAEWLDYLERELARPLAIAPDGARAFVELEEEGPRRRIVRTSAPVDPQGRTAEPDVALARRLPDRPVLDHGRLGGLGRFAPVILLDFALAGTAETRRPSVT